MSFLRWFAGSGLRVTLTIAVALFIYHALNELRLLRNGSPNFHQRLELVALDLKFKARGARPPPEWKVAIAAIDDKTIQAFGPPPLPRRVHAQLVSRLTELGAAVIAFDSTFEQEADVPEAKAAARLKQVAEQSGLWKSGSALEAAAQESERIAEALAKVKRPPKVKKQAPRLERVAEAAKTGARSIATFGERLDEVADSHSPDVALARAIRDSKRVVLGLIASNKPEAEQLGVTTATLAAQLQAVVSSTITDVTEVIEPLVNVIPGRDVYRDSMLPIYFGLPPPTPMLAKATEHFATLNAMPDDDGVNRRLALIMTLGDTGAAVPTLALKAVEVAMQPEVIELRAAEKDVLYEARIGELAVPMGLRAATFLDWYGPFDTIPQYAISDIVAGTVPKEKIDKKIVFVAVTGVGTYDQRVTPLERTVPGVYLHATLAQNILDNRHLVRPFEIIAIELAVLIAIGLVGGLLMTRFDVIGQVVSALVMLVGWLAIDQLVFFEQGLIVYSVLFTFQVFLTLLAVALWRFLVEQRERRKTRQAFGQYLSPAVLEQVLSNPEEYLKLGGRRYEATVLFSDIRGFTTISESLTPEALGTLLNKYMTPMTDIVFDHQGTLDKYIGDAVMAFWGAPIELENHALPACRAALKMLEVVDQLNVQFEKEKLPHIAIGIGLSSGPMTVGNMGSDEHFSYTALGDRVNLGSRLEGQTKEYGVDIIISDACYALVKDEMLCRELGALRVKGKNEPVRIYELIGPRSGNEHRLEFVRAFHAGLECFRKQQWEEAIESFTRARALGGPDGDKCSGKYITWCTEYQSTPPPPGWDGVHVATSK